MKQGYDEDEKCFPEKYTSIWFAKAVLRLKIDGDSVKIHSIVNTLIEIKNEVESKNKKCFVQYQEVLPKQIV